MNPSISIIIPVWNAEKTLRKCISSVLSQSFTSWELILSDDGSTDNSLDICCSIAKEYDMVKVLSSPHIGVSHARNVAIDIASGQYLCFIDADDVVEPKYLELLYEHRKYDLVVCGYSSELYDENDEWKESSVHSLPTQLYEMVKKESMKDVFMSGIMHMTWNKLFSKDIIDAFSIKYEMYPINEDFIFVLEYLLHCDNMFIVKDVAYHWIRVDKKKTGVESLPPNMMEIYTESHFLLRKVFSPLSEIADEIMYYSYEMVALKCIRNMNSGNFKERNIAQCVLDELAGSDCAKSAYVAYKPVSVLDKLLHCLLHMRYYKLYDFCRKIALRKWLVW